MKLNNNEIFIRLILTTMMVYALTAIPLLIVSNAVFKKSFTEQFISLSKLYKHQIEYIIKNKNKTLLTELLTELSQTPHITKVELLNYQNNIMLFSNNNPIPKSPIYNKNKDLQTITDGYIFNVNINDSSDKNITLRFTTNFNTELELYNHIKHVAILLFFAILIIVIPIFNYSLPANSSYCSKD